MNKLTNILLGLCLLGILYIIYYQRVYIPNTLDSCKEIAIGFERARNPSLEVTNQDISSYMKNLVSCLTVNL
jgi:hypothetical protein